MLNHVIVRAAQRAAAHWVKAFISDDRHYIRGERVVCGAVGPRCWT